MGYSCIIAVFAWIIVVVACSQNVTNWLKPGKCKSLWREAKLVGKCFGLRPYSKFSTELESISVRSSIDCRSICCNLGEECTTWQYYYTPKDPTNGECRLTNKIVRLGLEKTGTPDWCDPHPPSRWNGKRLKKRNDDGTCEWGEDLPIQCFGLGDERKTDDKKVLNTLQCANACCENKNCEMWQESPGRGCYYAKNIGRCNGKSGIYDGGRKCLPTFCDGREAELLK